MNSTEHTADTQGEIVARAGSYYRNTRYIIAAACVVMGLWFGYDGFIGYPEENRRLADVEQQLEAARQANDVPALERLTAERKELGDHHSDTDIRWQRNLSFILPPLGLALLIRWLYVSRGQYRLSGNTIHAPGHPPIPLSSIRDMDMSLWDRKGIAKANYTVDGQNGTIVFDDFVYERRPIDAIVERIGQELAPAAPETPEAPLESTAEAPSSEEGTSTPS